MFGWCRTVTTFFQGIGHHNGSSLVRLVDLDIRLRRLAAILVVTGSKVGPMDATAQMELLAKKLERTAAIPSETASEIARVIGQPWYDCGHVACSAQLGERNRAVRAKLSGLLATKERSNDLSASQKRRADSVALSH
jgi:hypothetical protein